MDKKYQFFVSSTYTDLIEERQAVFETIVESGNIPVGMEYFPTSPEDQFSYIKRLIDNCDYYLLIVGGRYGTINEMDEDRRSYTEMEYDYAIEKGIPVVTFVPTKGYFTEDKLEDDNEKREKRKAFIKKVQQKLCKFYESKEELQKNVAMSMNHLFNTFPRAGWIRGNITVPSNTKIAAENISLMDKYAFITEGELEIETKWGDHCENENYFKATLTKTVTWKSLYEVVGKCLYIENQRKKDIEDSLKKSLNVIEKDPWVWYVMEKDSFQQILEKLERAKLIAIDTSHNIIMLTPEGRELYLELTNG